MRPEPSAFDDVLASLADGTPIDWAALEAGAVDEQAQRRFRNLRLVARVAELHRSDTLDDGLDETPAPPSPAEAAPPVRWGPLQVRERLASGAFGDVYRAHDPHLDRDVALKLLRVHADGSDTTRLLSEAQALARVQHPNVVIVHGADIHDGRAGLWMELVSGRTLAALAGDRGRLDAGEVVTIGRDVCRALAAIHAAGLVHGDVKTQNVMRDAGGRTVLMDFGAGRRLGAATADAGTPMYLAPEVLAGGPPTAQSDLYGLGVMLFTLLTQRFPYEADSLDALRQAHANGDRIYLRDLRAELPDAVVDVVERALDSDPAQRFASAGAMERALADLQAPPRRWLGPAIAALAAAAAVAGVVLLWPHAPRSLAVLPFASADASAAYLIDGLNRDVIRELQRYDVQISTTEGTDGRLNTSALRSQVRADAIVAGEGRVTATGVAFVATLSRGASPPFWTRTYDVPLAGLPALAATIARDLGAEAGIAQRPGAPPIYQPNALALQAYHQGRLVVQQREKPDLLRGLDYYNAAIKHDPNYAEAWTGIADVYMALAVPPFGDLRPQEARVKARQALDRALKINRDLAEAETSLAWAIASFDWDWPAAELHFTRALTLNPQYGPAQHYYSMLLTDLGRFDDALAALTRARAAEPLSLLFERDAGWIYFMWERYDDAERVLRETLSRQSDYWPAMTMLARTLAARGDFGAALAELDRGVNEKRRTGYLGFRGYIEALAGDPRARQTLTELQAHAQQNYVPPYYFALVYTALGQPDDAIRELQRAHAEQDTTLTSVNVDPRFAPLRADARFQAIVQAMRLPPPRR
jgi:tetratricopeptide (TPR) repeat protein